MASSAGPTKPGEYSPWRVLANFDNVKIDDEDCGHDSAYVHVEGDNATTEDDAEGLGTVGGGGYTPPQWRIINVIYCIVALGVVSPEHWLVAQPGKTRLKQSKRREIWSKLSAKRRLRNGPLDSNSFFSNKYDGTK